jgi:hypothetical protein
LSFARPLAADLHSRLFCGASAILFLFGRCVTCRWPHS